jgi:hypothetical protein
MLKFFRLFHVSLICKRIQKDGNFSDLKTIRLEAGAGGNGCVSFGRAKFVEFGPPDGGQ